MGTSSSCWHSLFGHSAVALNYPVDPRNEGRGLEISFNITKSLARTDFIVERQDGLVVRGLKWMLVPMKHLHHEHDRGTKNHRHESDRKAIQWYLIKVSDAESFFEANSSWLNIRKKIKLGKYIERQAFLGCCDKVSINVATEEALYDVKYSSARTKRRPFNLATPGIPLIVKGIGISPGSQLGPRQDRTHLELAHELEERLSEKKDLQIVICDSDPDRAWMLPYLNVLLHLVHMRAAFLDTKPDDETHKEKIVPPYTIVSKDRCDAAYHAIIPLVELVRKSSNSKPDPVGKTQAPGIEQHAIRVTPDPRIVFAQNLVKYLENLLKWLDESHKKFGELTNNDISSARAGRRIYGF